MPTETIVTVAGVLAAFGFFAIVLAYSSLTSEPVRISKKSKAAKG